MRTTVRTGIIKPSSSTDVDKQLRHCICTKLRTLLSLGCALCGRLAGKCLRCSYNLQRSFKLVQTVRVLAPFVCAAYHTNYSRTGRASLTTSSTVFATISFRYNQLSKLPQKIIVSIALCLRTLSHCKQQRDYASASVELRSTSHSLNL